MSDNVVKFPGATILDISPQSVLEEALAAKLTDVVVLGYDADGVEYMASSTPDGGDIVWLLERCKHRLLTGVDDI